MHILLTGGHGFIGSSLAQHLQALSHTVSTIRIGAQSFPSAPPDVVINLAGYPLAKGFRWNKKTKQTILESRVETTKQLVDYLQNQAPKAHLISASALGFYGDRGLESLDESSSPGEGFLSQVCQAWEQAAACYPHTHILRLGIVLDPKGGYLRSLYWPTKLGASYLGRPDSIVSWISLIDLIELISFLIPQTPSSPQVICAAAPEHTTSKSLSKRVAALYHGADWFAAPAWAVQAIFGEKSELLTQSAAMFPQAALRLGFTFKHPNIKSCFNDFKAL